MNEETAVVIVTAIVFGIPLLGITARLAIKPVVEALIRLRETFPQTTTDTPPGSQARIEALETRVDELQAALKPLVEAEEFRRQLEAGRSEKERASEL